MASKRKSYDLVYRIYGLIASSPNADFINIVRDRLRHRYAVNKFSLDVEVVENLPSVDKPGLISGAMDRVVSALQQDGWKIEGNGSVAERAVLLVRDGYPAVNLNLYKAPDSRSIRANVVVF